MVSNAGGGYSRWKNIAVTRWHEDSTRDNRGNFCFIRDIDNNEFWSAAYQPALQNGDHYEAVFSQGRAEFRRRDFAIETHTEIVVSPEDDVELRRLHLTNRSRKKRIIEIASYAEVVLAPLSADAASWVQQLFVETELLPGGVHTLRDVPVPTRAATFHVPPYESLQRSVLEIAYETDRTKFIGAVIHHSPAMQQHTPLSSTAAAVSTVFPNNG